LSLSSVDSKSLPRDQDEEDTESGVDKKRHCEDHNGTLREKFLDVRLSHPGEVERRVLTQAN
jgi:hypothetical protein